ncbi:MAG: hypothetical protein H7A23_18385 [Leptospiraceae bacterium]|nr:hypothetical protein [Leptospiraceae bacterium]
MDGSILFCGAFEGEVDIIKKYHSSNILITGVGSAESLFNLQYFLHHNKHIHSVVFVGSAGAYPHSTFKVGDFVYSNKFLSKDIAEIRGLAKVPAILKKSVITNIDPRLKNLVLSNTIFSGTITNSTNYITTVDLEMEELVNNLYDVGAENMEVFSLAYAAYHLSVPFISLKVITNIVGKNGSAEWQKNWRESSNQLQSVVLDFFASFNY